MSMKTFAFKYRLFLIYSVVISLVVILFTAVLYVTTTGMNRQTELYYQTELYKKNLGQIENILRQMDRLASQVVSNNEILGVFIPLASDGNPGNYFDEHLIDGIRINSLLSSINGTDKYASRISVFNRGGDYVSTGTLYETPDAIQEALTGEHYDAVKAKVVRAGSESLVVDFHADTWSRSPTLRLMSLYRALSSYTSTVYGLVEIQVSADAFEEYAFWRNGGTEYFLVNRAGNIVYPFEDAENADRLFSDLSAAFDAGMGDVVMLEKRMDRRDYILMCARVLPSDWLFVRVLPASALLAPSAQSIAFLIGACLALLCCLIATVYYLANRIAKPLQSLSAQIAGVNLQNMQLQAIRTSTPYSIAELDALSRSFHAMLTRLDKSIMMEIQAHMRALQSQMNPHFLFNMLSVIIESSEEKGDDRTVAMCLKLSAMLRYIADYNGDNASFADELQHTKNYLDLMKDRYEDLLEYEIVTQGDLTGITIPKMIIQPLVENCFSHGFRDCKPPWHVRVEAAADGDRWTLRIVDNGSGITEETIRMIHEKVAIYRSDVATNYKTLRLGGMGLVNTLLRLSLSANGQIDFAIANSPDRGTTVEIGGSIHDPRVHR